MELNKADVVLDNYIKNEPIGISNTPPSDEESINDFLSDNSVDVSLTPVESQAKNNSVAKEIDKRNKEEATRIQEEKEQQAELRNNQLTALTTLNDNNPIAHVADKIGNSPTPGGIGLLLVSLIFFIWVIVPVDENGTTRLKLLWLTLTGHTKLQQVYLNAESSTNNISLGGGTETSTNNSGNGLATYYDLSMYEDIPDILL